MNRIRTKNVRLDKILTPEKPSRFDAESSAIEELAASIRELGLLQAPVVRPEGDGYRLVAGHRRLMAVKILGWKTVSCSVVDVSPERAEAMRVVENLQRANLNPLEEAVSLQELKNATSWSDAEIALKIGKRREYVTRMRSLLDLDEGTLDALPLGLPDAAKEVDGVGGRKPAVFHVRH